MNPYSPKGKQRFLYFLNQLESILQEARLSKNPAQYAFESNMRITLFMLEGLSRLYEKIHDQKIFSKMNDEFKELEDCLGTIDYYDGFHKEFAEEEKPDFILGYLKKKKEKRIKKLNEELDNWIAKKSRVARIIKKLNKVSWLNEKEDSRQILKVYEKALEDISKNGASTPIITDIENDLHEFRRDLRWLSIYPQVLRGLIQLKATAAPQDFLKKYHTIEIIESPYNVMPDGSGLQFPIELDQNYYFALSWMIAELGRLKDSGLKIIALAEALKKQFEIKGKNARELAVSICGPAQPDIPEILNQSQNIINTFFEEKILDNLIIHSENVETN